MTSSLQKKSGSNYGPPGSAKMIFFIDDFNLPALDAYNTQSAIALIRQHVDYGHWCDNVRKNPCGDDQTCSIDVPVSSKCLNICVYWHAPLRCYLGLERIRYSRAAVPCLTVVIHEATDTHEKLESFYRVPCSLSDQVSNVQAPASKR